MANQQIFPSSTYPAAGDLQTTPGSPSTTVVGLQMVPISAAAPSQGNLLTFLSGLWTPSGVSGNNNSISVTGVSVSEDYWCFVNRKDTEVQVNSAFAPNGFPILAAGSAVNTP
jgi:hypothetical protein